MSTEFDNNFNADDTFYWAIGNRNIHNWPLVADATDVWKKIRSLSSSLIYEGSPLFLLLVGLPRKKNVK